MANRLPNRRAGDSDSFADLKISFYFPELIVWCYNFYVANQKIKEKLKIGWRESISLQDFGVTFIKVKVDTGAATSALHAEDIQIIEKNGKKKIRFLIYPYQKSKKKKIYVETYLVGMKRVKSSTGHITERPVVRTQACIGNFVWPIEITLVNRDIMGFRMLLGRRALKKFFIVDPGKSFLKSNKT